MYSKVVNRFLHSIQQSSLGYRVGLCWLSILFYFILINLFLLYNIVLVLPYINMNPPQVYMSSHPEPPSHLPPHTIPLGHPSAPALRTLYHASNLDWQFISHVIIYMFQCPLSHIIPPSPSPTESKGLFSTSVSLLLSRIQGYHYLLSKFHIYALVYCIGVFPSGLLHSV